MDLVQECHGLLSPLQEVGGAFYKCHRQMRVGVIQGPRDLDKRRNHYDQM